jgi:hypothetical protein
MKNYSAALISFTALAIWVNLDLKEFAAPVIFINLLLKITLNRRFIMK